VEKDKSVRDFMKYFRRHEAQMSNRESPQIDCIAPFFSILLAVSCDAQTVPAETHSDPSYKPAQPTSKSVDLGMFQRIRDEGLFHSDVMEFASALNDPVNTRLTGSPDYQEGDEWARRQLVMNDCYANFFTRNLPARSAVEVAGLPRNGLVEIEATALGQTYL
jgi:hypothetical protein